MDTIWKSTINAYANATTPLVTNLLLAHPDALSNYPGNLKVNRVLSGPNGRTISIFNDGSIYEIDTNDKKYNLLGNLFAQITEDIIAPSVADAHVFDGTTLKSFIMDSKGNSYLVRVDFSVSPLVASVPLFVIPVKGINNPETPLNAFMLSMHEGEPEKLAVILGAFS